MSVPLSPPKIPTGQELYDAIMGHIEPELTSEGMKTIATTYANETPEDFERRKKRYALALERYEQAYAGYMETLHAQVTRFRRDSVAHLELDDRRRDEDALAALGQGILKLA